LKGEIEQEKLDSYDVHFYAPSREEIEDEVTKEGSLKLERLEMFDIDKKEQGRESYGTDVAKAVRAIQESMISNHFGERILDSLFENYAMLVDEEIAKEDINPITFVLVLRKIWICTQISMWYILVGSNGMSLNSNICPSN